MLLIPCDPTPIEPITILSLGAIFLSIPKADEGIIWGSTIAPATSAAERFTKSLLDDLFALIYYFILCCNIIVNILKSHRSSVDRCFEYHINSTHFNFGRTQFH